MTKLNRGKELLISLISAVLLIIFDQYTKNLAVAGLKGQEDIPIIKDIFELAYVENRGAAFGMLQNQQILFAVLTIAVLAGIVFVYLRLPVTKRFTPAKATLTLLTAGAIGNFIDRVTQGYVVDFFYFKLIDFPVFNVADIYVCVSVFFLAVLLLFYYKEEEIDEVWKGSK